MTSFIKPIYYSLCLVAFAMGITACDEEATFTRADAPATTDNGVYFPITNKTQILRGEDEEKSFDVKVCRTTTAGALTVPIQVLSQSDNIQVPASVSFADGEASALLTITYSDLLTTPKCEIAIDDAFANPYKKKEGSTRASFDVYKLNLVTNNIVVSLYKSSSEDHFSGVTGQAIYQMGQDNRFVWKNYLGSGIDLLFKIDGHFDASDANQCYGDLIPLNHYQEDDYGWYLMDDEEGQESENYSTWMPEGCQTENGIYDYIYFYYKYQSSSYYYLDFRRIEAEGYTYGWGYISSSVCNTSGNYQSYDIYLYF